MSTLLYDIKRWDEWFHIVGGESERAWCAAKSQFPDDTARQLSWARIIEFNRIMAETEKSNTPQQSGQPNP